MNEEMSNETGTGSAQKKVTKNWVISLKTLLGEGRGEGICAGCIVLPPVRLRKCYMSSLPFVC